MRMKMKCKNAACQKVYPSRVKNQRRFRALFETVTYSARPIISGITTVDRPLQVASF